MDTKISSRKGSDDIQKSLEFIIGTPTDLDEQTVQQIRDNVWELLYNERYNLYRYWLLKYQQYIQNSLHDASEAYEEAISSLGEHREKEDYHILKGSLIVAMTTTGAAKCHKLLQKLRKKIFILYFLI
jgi:hypothetical protein